MAIIEMTSVSKRYQMGETQVDALLDIELTIDKGEFIAVWGPSGSGKTTLLNLLGAIDEPTKGKVYLKGQSLTELSDQQRSDLRSSSIGFIFQNFNLIPVLNALENVMLPLQIQGEISSEAKRKARKWLAKVELSRVERHRPDKMSGGQQQRVAIARAFISKPEVVMADEPVASLDPAMSRSVLESLKTAARLHGATVICTLHQLEYALEFADRIVALRKGKVFFDGRPGDLDEQIQSQLYDLAQPEHKVTELAAA